MGSGQFIAARGTNTQANAKAVCSNCVVMGECLDYAMVDDSLVGIWGGTSEPRAGEDEGRVVVGEKPAGGSRFRTSSVSVRQRLKSRANQHTPTSSEMPGRTAFRVVGELALPPCQGEGRGFESRRPLQTRVQAAALRWAEMGPS